LAKVEIVKALIWQEMNVTALYSEWMYLEAKILIEKSPVEDGHKSLEAENRHRVIRKILKAKYLGWIGQVWFQSIPSNSLIGYIAMIR